jgi:hypothetical protein
MEVRTAADVGSSSSRGTKFIETRRASAEYERRIERFVADNPQHKYGPHHYFAADFGLSESEIAERFSKYTSRFPALRRAPGSAE